MSETSPIIVFDGHNDTLLDLVRPGKGGGRSFFESSERGHLDLPRAKKGGFGGGFFAIFVPQVKEKKRKGPQKMGQPVDTNYAQQVTREMIDLLFALECQADGDLKVIRDSDDLAECLDSDVVAALLHFEGAEAIEPDLSNLADYYDSGLRSLGLTWSRPNEFAYGVPFEFPKSPDTGPGLTPAGKDLVKACNELGIVVDLSHLNERGFWDVSEINEAPLVATHSAVHALCQSTRNLTDDQLDAIGASGGVVGINFHVGFLRSDGKSEADTPLSVIARHAQYVADRIGVDHVALGSDFDGATMPAPLGDVSGLPKLMASLRDAGFDDDALNKIGHRNWQRVLKQTWRD